jgi:hypothetical protein
MYNNDDVFALSEKRGKDLAQITGLVTRKYFKLFAMIESGFGVIYVWRNAQSVNAN